MRRVIAWVRNEADPSVLLAILMLAITGIAITAGISWEKRKDGAAAALCIPPEAPLKLQGGRRVCGIVRFVGE